MNEKAIIEGFHKNKGFMGFDAALKFAIRTALDHGYDEAKKDSMTKEIAFMKASRWQGEVTA